MLAKVLLVPANKDYIILRLQDGRLARDFPRKFARHVKAGDICEVVKLNNRFSLKVLTDEDELVIMNHPDRKQMVPAGYFNDDVTPPAPIQTPEV